MSEQLSDEALEALIRRYRFLGGEIAELQGEQKAIQDQVARAVTDGWKFTVDGVAASKRPPNRKFDIVTAVSLLGAEAKQRCIETAFSEKLVRKEVAALGLEDECMLDRDDAAPIVKLG